MSQREGLSAQVLQHMPPRTLLPPGSRQNTSHRNAMRRKQDRRAELDVDQKLSLRGFILRLNGATA